MNLSIIKPTKDKINTFLPIGSVLVIFSFIDVIANSFLNYNLTGFLPEKISYFLPLILGFIGFYLIRIEFSGVKFLDNLIKILIQIILMLF